MEHSKDRTSYPVQVAKLRVTIVKFYTLSKKPVKEAIQSGFAQFN